MSMDLLWMQNYGGRHKRIDASVLCLEGGKRIAVTASSHVALAVRIPEGEEVGLPAYEDVTTPSGRSQREIITPWITTEYRDAEVPREALAGWIDAEAPTQYGYVGHVLIDRYLVAGALQHAPEAKGVRIGFARAAVHETAGRLDAVVFSLPGFRAIVAPAKDGPHGKGAPLLPMPERRAGAA